MAKKKKEAEPPETGKDVGRPTDYSVEFNEQARRLALLGLTDLEMAEFFGCAESTFYLWKKEHAAFSEAIRAGKVKADADVATKLLDRALGAEWIEDVAFKVKTIVYSESGKKLREEEDIQIAAIRRAAPPDTQAASIWLRNRQPNRWKDKPEPTEDDDVQPVKVEVQVIDARKPTRAKP